MMSYRMDKGGSVLMFSVAVVLFFATALRGEEGSTISRNRAAGPAALADTEPADEAGRTPPASSPGRSPLIERLHAARAAGDLAAMRDIEASMAEPGAGIKGAGGEGAGGTILIPSKTFGGPGDPALAVRGGLQKGMLPGPELTGFGSDVKVRPQNADYGEYNQTMVSDSMGNLYVAWQDNALAKDYIQLYWSKDGGKSWSAYGFVKNSVADLKRPSLAVGQGGTPRLLLAYIMDDGVNIPVPEVATATLGSSSFSIHSVPVWAHWEAYDRPVINTDAIHWSSWFGYLTCEGIYDSAADNVNICHWRSQDFGDSWGDARILFGEFDTHYWSDPDETYGTSRQRLLVVTFDYTVDMIFLRTSDDWGSSWNVLQLIYTMPELPFFRVDPEIAAAVDNDNVMLCCTKGYNGADNIGHGYSKDGGDTWSTIWSMTGYTEDVECSASLTANEGGGGWHLAFHREEHVMYSRRPQDLSDYWESPVAVDDLARAFIFTSRKGIASNWNTDQACIAWSDYRDDPLAGDLDTFVDFPGNLGLSVDQPKIFASKGGTANFTLNAGPAGANRPYLLLGSVTGTQPGTPLPGGYATLPLNWDFFTNLVIGLVNTPAFQDFHGTLDGSGMGKAKLSFGPVGSPGYLELCFAFAVMNPWNYASNAVVIVLY